jgi:nucleoid DNA-binding protein
MRKRHGWALAALAAVLILGPAFAEPVVVQSGGKDKEATLKGRVAAASKVSAENVAKVLEALGPAVRDKLASGETVELPGLGTFRVVTVPEHRNLIDGRPATVNAANYVTFDPAGSLADAANAPGAVPAEVVPEFRYNPLPDQLPSLKTPNERMPTIRTP